MKKEKTTLICDLKNRRVIINEKVINLPASQFIIYLQYLKKRKSKCKYPDKTSCEDCVKCFETLYQTSKLTDELLYFYKQIYGEHSDHYQTLKMKSKKGQSLSHKTLLENISKINRKIKSHLKDEADPYMISSMGKYGCKVYGIKLAKNKIAILNKE